MISRLGVGANVINQVNHAAPKKEVETKPKEESRVDSIKAQIQNGTYKLDMSETAKKMSKELMGQQ
jgi:anti-sigma28 factor (negative regulator of flagellin synthesis)